MISQQIKQEITDTLKALNDQNAALRIEGIKQLEKIGVSHPQIIGRLQSIKANDSSPDVRLTAQHALDVLQNTQNDDSQNTTLQSQPNVVTPNVDNAIIDILQKQNQILENIQTLILNSTEKKSENVYRICSRIVDVDMSLGSMVELSFKWLIASIPVGIVIGFLLFFLRGCSY